VRGRPILEFAREVTLTETSRHASSSACASTACGASESAWHCGSSPRWWRRGLAALAFALTGLRRRYGVLSEKHARAEEALRRRDRLAAMGELASTVAHEVRNPLNAIGMTAQRLRREFLGATSTSEGSVPRSRSCSP